MTKFKIDSKSTEDDVIQIQGRSMSDPPLSDIDLQNKMSLVSTTLNIISEKLQKLISEKNMKNFEKD